MNLKKNVNLQTRNQSSLAADEMDNLIVELSIFYFFCQPELILKRSNFKAFFSVLYTPSYFSYFFTYFNAPLANLAEKLPLIYFEKCIFSKLDNPFQFDQSYLSKKQPSNLYSMKRRLKASHGILQQKVDFFVKIKTIRFQIRSFKR